MTSSTATSLTVRRGFAPLVLAAAVVPLLLIGSTDAAARSAAGPAVVLPSGDVFAALRTASETGVVPEIGAIFVLLMALIAPVILLLVRLDAAGRRVTTSDAMEVEEPWGLQGR